MNLKGKALAFIFIIFLLGLVLRFLYFPQNTYFGFDQARDAYAVKEILSGHLKITGPPTATGIINHGVLYYYIFSPFYFFGGGDPAVIAAFLRVLNAAGVFLVFLIVYPMFGRLTAYLTALLFAVSYEQTQFSLFLNHPSLAVISVLVFYLGLSVWIFRKRTWGLLLAIFGLGLSIQFEFVETQLVVVFILFLLLFKKHLPKFSLKNISLASVVFLLPLSSYIISEIKNNFTVFNQLPNLLSGGQTGGNNIILQIINRYIHDNIAAHPFISTVLGLLFLVVLIKLILKKNFKDQFLFLSLWFFGGLVVYFFINNDGYFYNTGTSISLLIFVGFLISKLFSRNYLLAFLILILIFFSNMYLIIKNNPLGPNPKINPQIGLLLNDQQRILDFIYQSAQGEDFAVNALTMPYNVNTTWSYLFEWYGQKKYGYLPVWGGDAAAGFPGNLQVERARSKLPDIRFLIFEPTEGIPTYLVDEFVSNESNYTNIIEKRQFGTMQVWVQEPK